MKKLREWVNSISWVEILSALCLAFINYIVIHRLFFKHIKYLFLNDFYAGISIYANVNKYSDILFIFLYFLLFFVYLYFIKEIKKLDFNNIKSYLQSAGFVTITAASVLSGISVFVPFSPEFADKIPLLITCIFLISYLLHIHFKKLPIVILQIACLFGFISPPPFSLNSHKITLLGYFLFILLIGVSLFDILRRRKAAVFKNRISPFALLPVIILLFGVTTRSYSNIDFHHLGEMVSTFWSVDNFGAKYYKDIMLVHGFADVLPFYLGKYVLGDSTLSGFYDGYTLLENIRVSFTFILLYLLFCGRMAFIFPAMCFLCSISFMIPGYLLIIKNYIFNKRYLFISLFIFFALLFANYRTSLGSAWIVAGLPVLGYAVYELCRDKKYSLRGKICYLCALMLALTLGICIFREEIAGYLAKAVYYLKGNLIVFGTMMRTDIFYPLPLRIFQYVIWPVILFIFIKGILNKDLKREQFFMIIFALLYPLLIMSYALGRVDGEYLTRSVDPAYQYLLVLVPCYLLSCGLKYKKALKLLSVALIFLSFCIVIQRVSCLNRKFVHTSIPNNNQSYNIGNIRVLEEETDLIKNVDSVLEKYSSANDDFLDLTNHGALYFFLNKKMPIPYVSFYNAISPELTEEYAQNFNPEKLKVIMISPTIQHDAVYASLRLPLLYRKILLSGKYSLVSENGNDYLVYSEQKKSFTDKELTTIDKYLGAHNLSRLPESWCNSHLLRKLKTININYKIEKVSDGYRIIFEDKIKGCDIDYIKLELSPSVDKSIYLKLNDIPTEIMYSSDSGKALVPFANYPSWLLADNVSEIMIRTKSDKIKISFLKK